METNNTSTNITDQLKAYFEIRYKLIKLQAIQEGSSIFASVIRDSIIVVFFTIFIIIFSVSLACFLGEIMGANWKGFGTTAILYLMIALLVKAFKLNIENLIFRTVVQKIFKRKDSI